MAVQDVHLELWGRLSAFELDRQDAGFPFTSRLAREQGWTHAEAARAILEYKRFLFLAVVSGHPVTPSVAVDHVWHLHLLYTRSYWQELCGGVLRRELHHEPTQGGDEEDAKFTDWYARTLESYQKHFGEPPPVYLWPSPAERMAQRPQARWVETGNFWLLPKPWPFRHGRRSPLS